MRSLPLPVRLKLTLVVAALLVSWALTSLAVPGGQGAGSPPATSVQTLRSIGVSDELVSDLAQEINSDVFSALGQPFGFNGVPGFSSNLGSVPPQQTLPNGAGLPGASVSTSQPAAATGSGSQGQSVSLGGGIQDVFAEPERDSNAGSSGEDGSGEDGDDTDGAVSSSSAGGSGDDGEDGDDEDEDDEDDDKDDDKDDDED